MYVGARNFFYLPSLPPCTGAGASRPLIPHDRPLSKWMAIKSVRRAAFLCLPSAVCLVVWDFICFLLPRS